MQIEATDGRLRRWAVPLAPFLFSLAFSISTLGDRVFWQDSGFYLAAVREFVPLYPPGFMLHLLLCKGWTLLVAPLTGYVRAVHLFSAMCAAGTAATAAVTARAFLARFFPNLPRLLPSIGAGALLAAGYSFAHAAILSKSYALFYLLLSILLYFMVVAERKRDFVLLGLSLGLSWAAHPLGAFVIPAVVAYAVARRDRIREWGGRWFAGVVAATAFGAFGPSILLPIVGARSTLASFGDPTTPQAVLDYLLGSRFLDQAGSFGFVGQKWGSVVEFVWEEFLAVGLSLGAVGFAAFAARHRRVLPLVAAWVLPIVAFTLVYLHEAYPDLWMVAVYLPASLFVAAGLARVAAWRPVAAGATLTAGLAWMVVANRPDLDQRRYTLAEDYGRLILSNVDPGAPVLLTTDDAISTTLAIRFASGEFKDRKPVSSLFLWEEWYRLQVEARLGLRAPDPSTSSARAGGLSTEDAATVVFVNANAGPGRAVFCERQPTMRFLRPDLEAVPAGLLWKVGMKGEVEMDPRYWSFPIRAEDVKRRRSRAHRISVAGGREVWHRETYEDRLLLPLLRARVGWGNVLLQRDPAAALATYDAARAVDRAVEDDPRFGYHRGVALVLLNRSGEARSQLEETLKRPSTPEILALTHFYLSEIAVEQRRPADAAVHARQALRSGPVPPAVIDGLRARAAGP